MNSIQIIIDHTFDFEVLKATAASWHGVGFEAFMMTGAILPCFESEITQHLQKTDDVENGIRLKYLLTYVQIMSDAGKVKEFPHWDQC